MLNYPDSLINLKCIKLFVLRSCKKEDTQNTVLAVSMKAESGESLFEGLFISKCAYRAMRR